MSTTHGLLELITAFHEAVNTADADRLASLAAEDVEVGGPRGTAQGKVLLREWVVRVGVQFHPVRIFTAGDVAVVEQDAEWIAPMTGESRGRTIVATLFRARAGLLSSVVRYDSLNDALAAGGLTTLDRTP